MRSFLSVVAVAPFEDWVLPSICCCIRWVACNRYWRLLTTDATTETPHHRVESEDAQRSKEPDQTVHVVDARLSWRYLVAVDEVAQYLRPQVVHGVVEEVLVSGPSCQLQQHDHALDHPESTA